MNVTLHPASVADSTGIQHVVRQSWHAAHDHILGEAAVTEFLDEYYDEESLQERIGGRRRDFSRRRNSRVGYCRICGSRPATR